MASQSGDERCPHFAQIQRPGAPINSWNMPDRPNSVSIEHLHHSKHVSDPIYTFSAGPVSRGGAVLSVRTTMAHRPKGDSGYVLNEWFLYC